MNSIKALQNCMGGGGTKVLQKHESAAGIVVATAITSHTLGIPTLKSTLCSEESNACFSKSLLVTTLFPLFREPNANSDWPDDSHCSLLVSGII